MINERMYDLGIELRDDGSIDLEQDAGCGEVSRVDLHPCQIRLLAELAGLLTPDPTARLSARHVGRLRALYERLEEIRRFYLDEIIDHCGSGIEFSLHLRAIEDLTEEMLADVEAVDGGNNAGSVTPALPEAVTECHEKSAVISVTPKCGRPKKEDALTPAERQRAHRAKQVDLPLTSKGPTAASHEQFDGATAH